jgi:hypothetical protein
MKDWRLSHEKVYALKQVGGLRQVNKKLSPQAFIEQLEQKV